MKKQCPKCNQVYDFEAHQQGQIFACLECGEDFIVTFDDPASAQAFPAKKSKTPLLIILFVFIAVLAGISIFALTGKKGSSAPAAPVSGVSEEQNLENLKQNFSQFIQAGDANGAAKFLQQQDLKKYGVEFLLLAVKSANTDMIATVLSCGVDINSSNEKETALHAATAKKDFATFKYLISKGASVAASNKLRLTLWGLAAEVGSVDIVTYLSVSQSTVQDGPDGKKAIFRALRNGHNECARILFDKYIVDEVDEQGNSILLAAFKAQNIDIAKMAIEKGASINVANNNNETPLFVAVEKQNPQLLALIDIAAFDLIQQTNAGISLPMLCVQKKNLTLLRKVTKAQNIDLVDSKGRTALFYACENNNIDAANFLLSAGAMRTSTVFVNSPLYISTLKGHVAIVKLLLDKGAPVTSDSVDREGNNLLMLVAASGNKAILDLLPLKKFNLFARNASNQTALDIAKEKNNSLAPIILDMMDNVHYNNVKREITSLANSSDQSKLLARLEELRKQMADYKMTLDYIETIQADYKRKLYAKATENVQQAIASARKDKYYESAIRTLEAAIANNPNAENMQEAKDYLEELKRRYAESKRRHERILKMSANELKEEVTNFINKWLGDMQMERNTSQYWIGTGSVLFNVKSWRVLGPVDGTWNHFSEKVLVYVESTNKGGSPLAINWKVSLQRSNDDSWKVTALEK